ncbi:MAG: DNA-processing protein DprA, partial [Pseudomonadota bacterium]
MPSYLSSLFGGNKSPSYSEETISILRLIRSENVGPRTFVSLIKMFGSPSVALDNIQSFAKRGGKTKPITVCAKDDALAEIDALNKVGAKLLTYLDPSYSSLLKHIDDFPPIISYRGNIELLQKRCVAIVGSRNASINGRIFAGKIAQQLVQNDVVVVSGLARGIDTAAHTGAVPKTIAVIAGGIDHIYPPENAKLFEQIAAEGLLIAELPIGTQPLGRHFPQRNRIISGVSLGTVIVEASFKSGSLITARFAAEQNREVFAVPGFPLDPRCQGTNHLIKEGAHLLESAEDIFNNLQTLEDISIKALDDVEQNIDFSAIKLSQDLLTDAVRKQVLECLSSTSITIEAIAQNTELPLPVIYTILLELELAGKVTRHIGGRISVIY